MPASSFNETFAVLLVLAVGQGCGSVPDVVFGGDDAAASVTPAQADAGAAPDAAPVRDAGADATTNSGPPSPTGPPTDTCPSVIPQGATACCSAGFACSGTCDESACDNCHCAATELCCSETHKCAPLGTACPPNGKGK